MRHYIETLNGDTKRETLKGYIKHEDIKMRHPKETFKGDIKRTPT